jgi:predicted MFS family arabinose efflux permease
VAQLLAASFLTGWSATLAQDLVPAAATLAPPEQRGRAVGTVMTGLLTGILLSRVVSGAVAETLGWHAMFLFAAASIAVLGAALWRGIPSFQPTTREPYLELLAALAALWRAHRSLRRAALAQGLLSLSFSAFWSTLAVMLSGAPFHLGAAAAGSFGIAGAAGALAAPVAGRMGDRVGPQRIALAAAGVTVIAFVLMLGAPLLPPAGQLALLVAGTVVFDLGVQASLISHQSIIYGLAPEARSRLNAVLMVSVFIGMASGGALGSQALAAWGWPGVVGLASISALAAFGVRLASVRRA